MIAININRWCGGTFCKSDILFAVMIDCVIRIFSPQIVHWILLTAFDYHFMIDIMSFVGTKWSHLNKWGHICMHNIVYVFGIIWTNHILNKYFMFVIFRN